MRRSDLVFFLSGSAALVYEVVWSRLLGRLLGSDAAGVGVVVAVFLGGMGLGAWLLARPARSVGDPRRLFFAYAVGLAGWAALSPFLLAALDPVAGTGGRMLLACLVLVPPTLIMGATFPLMGRLCIPSDAEAGGETSRFYGANTLGAAAGALLAPFALLPLLGLTGAVIAAAGLDLVAGALALGLAPPARPDAPAPTAARARLAPHPLDLTPLLLGASSLAFEVLMVRVLVSVTGASVYAFAIVLAVFLAGLGLGARQARGWLARHGAASVLRTAGAAVPALAGVGLLVLRLKTGQDVFGAPANVVVHGAGPSALWMAHALLAALGVFGPAFAFGVALPACVAARLATCEPDALAGGREGVLGRVYALNTLGSTLGALAATFLLLPGPGPRIGVALALAGAPVAVLPVLRSGAGRAGLLIAGGAVVAFLGLRPPTADGDGAGRLVARAVGPQASASVHGSREGDVEVLALRVNGKVVASTAPVDLRLQRLLGHVPGVLHGDVRRALVIGLGTGMTAGSLLDLPTLERLDVVEISPAVAQVVHHFDPWTGALLEDPRTHLSLADGRHTLLVSEERWDLITSDPIHPWTRGSSDLYAREHFERMRAHLAPGGIASQWLPLYQLSDEDVRTVVSTWCEAFPRTAAWLTAYDLALIGWGEAAEDPDVLSVPPLPPGVARGLAEAGIHGPLELAALQVADDAALRAFAGATPPMVEDHPVLEFRAPRSFLAGYSLEALAWAGRDEFIPRLDPGARTRAAEVRAALARFLERVPAGLSEAARRYGDELLALPPVPHGR